MYYGETGRNAFIRGREHDNDLRRGNRSNGLVRHMDEKHRGDQYDYKMAVLAVHRGCLGRQVEEGVRIREENANVLINSKSEFMQPSLIRIEIQEGNGEGGARDWRR